MAIITDPYPGRYQPSKRPEQVDFQPENYLPGVNLGDDMGQAIQDDRYTQAYTPDLPAMPKPEDTGGVSGPSETAMNMPPTRPSSNPRAPMPGAKALDQGPPPPPPDLGPPPNVAANLPRSGEGLSPAIDATKQGLAREPMQSIDAASSPGAAAPSFDYSQPGGGPDFQAAQAGQGGTQSAALRQLQSLQPPVPAKPNWLQRLAAMAVGAAGGYVNAERKTNIPQEQITSATQGILMPGYQRQLATYQAQREQLQKQAQLEEGEEKIASLRSERAATEEYRKGQAEERRRKAESYAADLAEKQRKDKAAEELARQKLKETGDENFRKQFLASYGDRAKNAQYQALGDPRASGWIFRENQREPGMGWMIPPATVKVTEGMLPYLLPGTPVGSDITWGEGQKIQDAIRAQVTNQAKQEAKTPTPTEQLLDAHALAAARKAGINVDLRKPILPQLPPEVQIQAANDYKSSPTDQAMKALTLQLTQARLDDLRQRQNPAAVQAGSHDYRVAQDLAYGNLTFAQFARMYPSRANSAQKAAIYDKARDLNPNFNPATFEMGYNLAKNPKVQQQLSALDNANQRIEDMLKFSEAARRAGATALNKFVVPGGVALGAKRFTDFDKANELFADEMSGALGFGNASDMKLQLALRVADKHLSPENYESDLLNVIRPFLEGKRDTLLKQMGPYGQPGMNPGAPPARRAAPAVGTIEDGHKFKGGDPANPANWEVVK